MSAACPTDDERARPLEHDDRVDGCGKRRGPALEQRAVAGRRRRRLLVVEPQHLSRMRREDAGPGMQREFPTLDLGEGPERVGVEDRGLRKIVPEREHDRLRRRRATEARADGHRIGDPRPLQDRFARGGRERAVAAGREAAGHHAGIERGRDPHDRLRHDQLDEPRAAAERRLRSEGGRPGHSGGAPHDEHPAVVALARVAAAAGKPRKVGGQLHVVHGRTWLSDVAFR